MNALRQKLRYLHAISKKSGLLFVVLAAGVFLAGWWIGRPAQPRATAATQGDPGTKWTCSMHPSIRQDGPGLCPICEMDLIPVSAASGGGLRDLTLSLDAVARLDIRVTPVLRQPVTNTLDFLGRVAPDETRVTTATARMDGRLDRLFIDYTGIPVRTGDHLAEIYSPDLYVAQAELIQAKQNFGTGSDRTRQALYRAAREKLRLLGIAPERIDAIEEQDEPTDHLTLNAHQDGIVLKLHKREGDYVKTGDPLFSLADLSQVWVFLEAYEDDLPWLRFAQEVEFHADAVPGRTFTGKIAFLDPILDEAKRIARIRVNVPNPDRALKPGMFIRGEVRSVLAGDRVLNPALAGKWISPMHPEIIKDGPGQCDICGMDLVPAEDLGFATAPSESQPPLLVPASSVLRTGDRAITYRRRSSKEGISFEGREIVLGPRAGDYFVVESGLREGDLVVTRGAFKLDSELQIRARPAMMMDEDLPGVPAPQTVLGAWKPVLRTLARAQSALADQEAFLAHLAQARQTLTAIEPTFLPDNYAPLWTEGSMQLENLLAIAQRDAKKHDPSFAWQNFLRDFPKRAALAGLPWQLPEPTALPPAQLAELNAIIDAYLPIAHALAHDQPAEALAAKAKLVTALQSASLPELAGASAPLSPAADEAALRGALKTVTDSLRPVLRDVGNDQLGTLYLVHCPMAFDSAGADWLSREAKIENPYYGSAMFSCGDITETLSLPAVTPPPPPPTKEAVDPSNQNP